MTICHSSVTSCHMCIYLSERYDGVYSSDSVSDRLMWYIYIIQVISYLVCMNSCDDTLRGGRGTKWAPHELGAEYANWMLPRIAGHTQYAHATTWVVQANHLQLTAHHHLNRVREPDYCCHRYHRCRHCWFQTTQPQGCQLHSFRTSRSTRTSTLISLSA